MTPLEKLDALPLREQGAFLALFSGAFAEVIVTRNSVTGEQGHPFFGKAECEWVPFEEFWLQKLPALGFVTVESTDWRPALGMAPGWTYAYHTFTVTEEGLAARDAYWKSVHEGPFPGKERSE